MLKAVCMSADTNLPSAVQHPDNPRSSFRILLIGGSGFIGNQLAPLLRDRGHHVKVASRNADISRGIIGRDGWASAIATADIIVFLSVINNNVDEELEAVRVVNVELPFEILSLIAGRSGQKLILFGSDHADSTFASDSYELSKLELAQRLRAQPGAAVTMLILSPVHGKKFVRKLAFIDRLPGILRSFAVLVIGALRPLSHVDRIADAIEAVSISPNDEPNFISVVDDQDRNFIYRSAIRLFDIGFAIGVIIFFGWLMAILAIAVAVTTTGPVLHKQHRVGRNGAIFICYKFRTMRNNTPQIATHQMSANSITAIGKRLRDWKLDELPQVFNIIANQMSLVGPRPCLPSQHELVAARKRLGVLVLKPGITGWSQIQGIDMRNPERLAQSDASFLNQRSILFYLQIVLLTLLRRRQGDRIL